MLYSCASFKATSNTIRVFGKNGKVSVSVEHGGAATENLDGWELLEAIQKFPKLAASPGIVVEYVVDNEEDELVIISGPTGTTLFLNDYSAGVVDLATFENAVRLCLPSLNPASWNQGNWTPFKRLTLEPIVTDRDLHPSWPPGTIICGMDIGWSDEK